MFILSGLATPFASPALFSLPPARLPLSCCYFSSAGCLSGCPQVSPCCSPPELPHRSLIPGWRTLAPKKWGGERELPAQCLAHDSRHILSPPRRRRPEHIAAQRARKRLGKPGDLIRTMQGTAGAAEVPSSRQIAYLCCQDGTRIHVGCAPASGDLLLGPEHARSAAYNTIPEEHLYYSLGFIRKGV